ncbi:MAG: lamin tail domain-containing protein, partial [Bacteroidia bacterium]|nr:lamin tail domain-containing protein [Bacteroidia bacterium]
AIALIIITSCKTDDVKPFVRLSSNALSISEDTGEVIISATISQIAEFDITVLLDTAGTSQGDSVDYLLKPMEIIIPAGSLTGSTVLKSVADNLTEGNETVEIRIKSIVGGTSNDSQKLTITIEDEDVPFQVRIIINEVLYDPSNVGLAGDANGDGVYSQVQDEFIEFINLSSKSVNLEGYKIFDADGLLAATPRHVFPANTIVKSGGCIVVFGGGTLIGTFGSALVQTSTTGDLNLTNAADSVTLTDPAGKIIVSYDYSPLSDNPNESYTRNPDITGDYIQHHFANTLLLFSPGTKIDGTPFLQ